MRRLAFPAGIVLALSACDPGPPMGQVIARVGSEEVTRRELAAELAASGEQDQARLVDEIVARKLLAAEARRAGVDHMPDFLAAERRNRELLLVEQFGNVIASKLPPPSPTDIRGFIAGHPEMFADRRLLLTDRIVTATNDKTTMEAIAGLGSADAVARYLAAHRIEADRTSIVLDSAQAPAALLGSPAGHPYVAVEGQYLTATTVLESRPTPVTGTEAENAARAALRRAAVRSAIDREILRLRQSARIEYQQGYGPSAQR